MEARKLTSAVSNESVAAAGIGGFVNSKPDPTTTTSTTTESTMPPIIDITPSMPVDNNIKYGENFSFPPRHSRAKKFTFKAVINNVSLPAHNDVVNDGA